MGMRWPLSFQTGAWAAVSTACVSTAINGAFIAPTISQGWLDGVGRPKSGDASGRIAEACIVVQQSSVAT